MATRRPRPAPSDRWGPLPPHARPRQPALARRLERALLAIGIVCLSYYGLASAETILYQRSENLALEQVLAAPPSPSQPHAGGRRVAHGTVGRIEIPRLGVSAVIKAGADARTLQLAVGHIPGTALPGEAGNVGLAGHRDTFFRRLSDIEPDDEIRVATPERTFRYRVQRTDIVEPRDVWVLDPTEHPALTLVTCYPFTYVGSAPHRFIVRAQLIGEPGR